eukprot:scaffold16396_cov115-Isochrysis_galbana.AAC.3
MSNKNVQLVPRDRPVAQPMLQASSRCTRPSRSRLPSLTNPPSDGASERGSWARNQQLAAGCHQERPARARTAGMKRPSGWGFQCGCMTDDYAVAGPRNGSPTFSSEQ